MLADDGEIYIHSTVNDENYLFPSYVVCEIDSWEYDVNDKNYDKTLCYDIVYF